MFQLDPERLDPALASLWGAALYGLFSLSARFLGGQPATWRDYVRAAINVACAAVAGALLAWFLTPAAVAWIPVAALRDKDAVGFVFGAISWEVLPVAIAAIRGRIGRLGGGN